MNITAWTFVCFKCAGYLREFNHRIKSVSSSTFSQEEIDQLKKWGNNNTKGKWLATWDPQNDPIPSPVNVKRVKDFMIRKYIDKLYFWDPEAYPQEEQDIIPSVSDLPNLLLDSSHASESTLWNSPPPPQWKSESCNTPWKADFTSAFPPPASLIIQKPLNSPTLLNTFTTPDSHSTITLPNSPKKSPLSIDFDNYQNDDFLDPLKKSKPLPTVKKSSGDPFSDLLGLDLSSIQKTSNPSSEWNSTLQSENVFDLPSDPSVSKKESIPTPTPLEWDIQWNTPSSPCTKSIPSPNLKGREPSIWDSYSQQTPDSEAPPATVHVHETINQEIHTTHPSSTLGVELDSIWGSDFFNPNDSVHVSKSDLDKEVANLQSYFSKT